MAICEQCGKEHDGKFASGRFCSRSCSARWVALRQPEESKASKVEKGKANLEKGRKARLRGCCLPGKRHKFTSEDRRKSGFSLKTPIQEILSNKKPCQSNSLKVKLVEEGFKEWKCERCNISEWLGEKIPIELHHKDGNSKNNSLENLEILCPNCHALTKNYCKRKSGRPHEEMQIQNEDRFSGTRDCVSCK